MGQTRIALGPRVRALSVRNHILQVAGSGESSSGPDRDAEGSGSAARSASLVPLLRKEMRAAGEDETSYGQLPLGERLEGSLCCEHLSRPTEAASPTLLLSPSSLQSCQERGWLPVHG